MMLFSLMSSFIVDAFVEQQNYTRLIYLICCDVIGFGIFTPFSSASKILTSVYFHSIEL